MPRALMIGIRHPTARPFFVALLISVFIGEASEAQRIVFERSEDGVYSVNPDGSDVVLLETGGRDPALSPDGKLLVIQDGNGSLLTMDTRGGDRRDLAQLGFDPTWSVDGSMIAYQGFGPAMVVNSDGSNPRPVGESGWHPLWSARRRDVLYYVHVPQMDAENVRMVNVSTGDTSTVIPGGYFPEAQSYAESPDGTFLLYGYFGPGLRLRTMRLDTGEVSEIGPSGGEGPRSAAWSPDGSLLAYDVLGGRGGLFVSWPDGSNERLLVPGVWEAAPLDPAWSPDGSTVAFHMRNYNGGPDRLHVIDLDGSNLRSVTIGSSPQWAPIPSLGLIEDDEEETSVTRSSWASVKHGLNRVVSIRQHAFEPTD